MKFPVSFRLSAHALRILAALAEKLGTSKTGVIERLLRERERK